MKNGLSGIHLFLATTNHLSSYTNSPPLLVDLSIQLRPKDENKFYEKLAYSRPTYLLIGQDGNILGKMPHYEVGVNLEMIKNGIKGITTAETYHIKMNRSKSETLRYFEDEKEYYQEYFKLKK